MAEKAAGSSQLNASSVSRLTDNEKLESCLFKDRFPIASLLSDPVRWDSDWSRGLRKMPATKVYDTMRIFLEKRRLPAPLLKQFQLAIRELQKDLLSSLSDPDWEHGSLQRLMTTWYLLKDKERRRYLLHGLVEASRKCTFRQNARALCPEITASSMNKTNGRAFIDLMVSYHEKLKSSSSDALLFWPSEWWSMASPPDTDDPRQKKAKMLYDMLTIQREEFIGTSHIEIIGLRLILQCVAVWFIRATLTSILSDLVDGSVGMNKAQSKATDDPILASMFTKAVSELRTKPLLRCENCTKSEEELDHRHFMICSACKNKINFSIHYCSPYAL